MKTELLSCPFCGHAVYIKRDPENLLCAFVCEAGSICRGSGLHVGFIPENEASAIEAWNRRAQPAQAGQVLTRDDILDAWMAVMYIAHATQRQEAFARAVEQAVLAKLVPMTPKTLTLEQCVTFAKLAGIKLSPAQFSGVLEAEVSEFELQTFANLCIGIVGKEGGNV